MDTETLTHGWLLFLSKHLRVLEKGLHQDFDWGGGRMALYKEFWKFFWPWQGEKFIKLFEFLA